MLPTLLLVAITAMTPTSASVSPVQLPDTDSREALAAVHNSSQRVVPFGGGRYLLVYRASKVNVTGALMRGTQDNPYVIVPAAALPRPEREGTALGQFVDAALLEDKTFAASATALPVKGNGSAIIFYDFGPDHEPNPRLAIRLRGCVGGVVAGPAASVVALTDGGITVLSRDGVVLGEVLKDVAGCADNRLARISANRFAVYNAAKQQVVLFRLEVGKQAVKGEGQDWRDADYTADSIAEATIEKTIDVSEGASVPVKALHVDANGNLFLVRGNTVLRFDGQSVRSWQADREWGPVYWDGETIVALTKNAHWQKVKF